VHDREAQQSSGARDPAEASRAKQPPVTPGLSPESWVRLQQTVGNQAVAALIARWPVGWASAPTTPLETSERTPIRAGGGETAAATPPRRRPTLSEAVGFESRFENPSSWANALSHPITQTLIRLLRKQLYAKLVSGDHDLYVKYAREQAKLAGHLRRTMYGLLGQAPNKWMFQAELLVLGTLLAEIEGASANVGRRSWHKSREDILIRSLAMFDTGFARMMSGTVTKTRVGRKVPGGSMQRRIYVGTAVVPGVVCNFFLVLNTTFPAKGGAPTIGVTASDEVGKTHDVRTSRSVEISGEQASGTVDLGARGPEGAGGQITVKGAGEAEATGSVTLDAGGKPKGSVAVKGEHGKIDISTTGISAEHIAPGKDWKANASMGKDGRVSYSATHPTLGGVTISGSFDRATLRVLAPELQIGGVTCQPELIVELWPVRLAMSKTQTQTAESLRAFRKACLAMMAVTGVPLALGVGAGGVAVVAEGAPVLLQAGRALAGAAAAP
jgi:hypothetical protein